jgi:hypothetical protein
MFKTETSFTMSHFFDFFIIVLLTELSQELTIFEGNRNIRDRCSKNKVFNQTFNSPVVHENVRFPK